MGPAVKRLVLSLLLVAAPAGAALSPAELAGAGAKPPADARLPRLPFVDQAGAPYALAPAAMPTVLLFADFSCRHLCGPGITLTAGALHDAGLVPGRDYRMIVIGLDRDGPARARRLADEQLRGLPAEADAMRLLTGTPAAVTAAEQALGYHAVHDATSDQFAHDAVVYLFTPDGRLSALLPEAATAAPQMAAAVARARAGAPFTPAPVRDTSLAGRVVTLCYGLAAAHGIYGRTIATALQAAAAALCLALGGFLIWSARRRKAAA